MSPRSEKMDPEHATLEAFIAFLEEDEAETFTQADLATLNENLGIPTRILRLAIEAEGYKLVAPAKPQTCRTFQSNPHDRWYGPGSSASHGGSGHEQINGFAGREG